ncbi:putative diguanylate cyclase YdaM [Massilia sp. Bi118]|uniref:GGDEF domain-containing protein n=1 Tax=Massilia sp. Bi118 TaxID=2822346 RepID=UPI001DE4C26F|nr:GGDEF domain-containing protein [Massilia sp. Bi118]CAH0253873.1 putative diguanylate cyclase YdaM [Massilia sp. Bi118]
MIDIQTFMLALGVGNIAFALLMAGYMRGADNSPALCYWMWGRLSIGLAQLCWWAAPQFELRLVEAVSACAWLGGVALEVGANCLFFGFTRWRKSLYLFTLPGWVAVCYAVATGASRLQLTELISFIIALYVFGAAVVLLRPRKAPLLQRLIGVNNILFALAIWAWLGFEGGSPGTATAPVIGLAYLASYLLMIVNGFGFLLLCKQKDDELMRRLATIDGLTGMLNRRAFFERADGARQLALRLRKPIALLMLDIDHFKQLNDSYGHASGDDALKVFADTARGVLREHDLIGRLGGEEFALVLPATRLEGALEAAERLRLAVLGVPVFGGAPGYRMTVSIGAVTIEAGEELTAALARADHALYAAKTGGRNRVEVGQPMLKRA